MIGGVVLAAGASRRAGTVKALATIEGEPLVVRAARVLREGGCDEVVVVVAAPHGERVAAALGPEVTRVENPAPERGMLSSLRCALSDEWEAAVVSLVDHPRVLPGTVEDLIDAWRDGDAQVVRPRFDARSGHPYLVARSLFEALRAGDDDAGARPVFAAASRLDVDVRDPGIHDDLDTATELASLQGTG